MKVPDKIYIQPRIIDELPRQSYVYTKRLSDTSIEYIRKDYLLEWLDGKLTIEGATEGFVGGYDSALKDVIDKLNEI